MSRATLPFPPVTPADWRRLVDQELKGRPFDQALVDPALEGVAIAPLYTEAPPLADAARHERAEPFRVCMRHEAGAGALDLVADAAGGADALWLPLELAQAGALSRPELAGCTAVLEAERVPDPDALAGVAAGLPPAARVALAADPIAWRAQGRAPLASLGADLCALGALAAALRDRGLRPPTANVSTLPYHDAGADAADEVAIALAVGVAYHEALAEAGLGAEEAARAIALRLAVGRDTFVEISKLRALRLCWAKVLAACGAPQPGAALVHAVCSAQTLSVRDPWVNMLRVTTQVFAAATGGADLVTPHAFDGAFGAASATGRRLARNTGLVLREESALGRVGDPAGGSYFFETLTDALARTAWARFQDLERDGGIVAALESGRLAARLEARRRARQARVATRRLPIVGVSEFANLDEVLPHPLPRGVALPTPDGALPAFRDAEPFEELRRRAEELGAPEVVLVVLGSFAESRPRATFAAGLFAAGGVRSREAPPGTAARFACLCGTDEQYAAQAAACARALRAAGARRVLLAGRPGPREAELREAGVDGFLHLGCDAVAVLSELLAAFAGERAAR